MATSIVTYSSNNVNDTGPWTDGLVLSGTSDSWYCRLEIPGASYSGPVKITWQLEQKTETWGNVTDAYFITDMVLDGAADDVYATTDGEWATGTGNYDWGDVDSAGTFRVMAYIESS
jgi:hypothetical protein